MGHIELPTSVRKNETEEFVRDVVGGMMKSIATLSKKLASAAP